MNAHQRRTHRRALPPVTGCHRQGYSGTTRYPDLMCTDGYMNDMDADGYDPTTARLPCAHCQPAKRAEWDREQRELEEDAPEPEPDAELPAGLRKQTDGVLVFECNSCGEETKWEGDPHDFDINHYANVCNRSQFCVP